MTKATDPVYKKIAVVFDFDDTLAPDSYETLLNDWGLDRQEFADQRVLPLVEAGWDHVLARFYCLMKEARARDDLNVTRDYLYGIGAKIDFFDQVPEMFDHLRQTAKNLIDDVEVCFYLVSSGIQEIAAGSPIADQFDELWGCEWSYDEDDGEIDFIKRVITHPEKVRYIQQIAKGVSEGGELGRPTNVYRSVGPDEWNIPFDQIIYVGDGSSDMPVFDFLQSKGGICLAVYKSDTSEAWDRYENMSADRHVYNLAAADYSPDAELMRSLCWAVESICKHIQIRVLSQEE